MSPTGTPWEKGDPDFEIFSISFVRRWFATCLQHFQQGLQVSYHHFQKPPLRTQKAWHHWGFLLELLGDEAFRRRGELEPQAIALLVNAHARLQMSNPLLFELRRARCCHESGKMWEVQSGRCKANMFIKLKLEGCNLEVPFGSLEDQPWLPEDYFAHDIPRRMRAHNLQSLCLVSSAFAKSRKSDDALFATWMVWVRRWRLIPSTMPRHCLGAFFSVRKKAPLNDSFRIEAKIGDYVCTHAAELQGCNDW